MSDLFDFLSDSTEDTTTRFICFIGGQSMQRFGLAITTTSRFYGKNLITDLQGGRTAISGPDDLEEDGYLERAFKISEEEANELRTFLHQIVGLVTFTDE